MWQNWVTGALGTWLIIASFTMSGNPVNQLIVGIAVAILGFWTAARQEESKGGQKDELIRPGQRLFEPSDSQDDCRTVDEGLR